MPERPRSSLHSTAAMPLDCSDSSSVRRSKRKPGHLFAKPFKHYPCPRARGGSPLWGGLTTSRARMRALWRSERRAEIGDRTLPVRRSVTGPATPRARRGGQALRERDETVDALHISPAIQPALGGCGPVRVDPFASRATKLPAGRRRFPLRQAPRECGVGDRVLPEGERGSLVLQDRGDRCCSRRILRVLRAIARTGVLVVPGGDNWPRQPGPTCAAMIGAVNRNALDRGVARHVPRAQARRIGAWTREHDEPR